MFTIMLCRYCILSTVGHASALNRHRVLIITGRFGNRFHTFTARNFKFSRRFNASRHTHSLVTGRVTRVISRHGMRTALILVQVGRYRRTSRRRSNGGRRRVRTDAHHGA